MSRSFDLDLPTGGEQSSRDLLIAIEENLVWQRQGEVERLELVLAWCDRFGDDPQQRPEAVPESKGGDRLLAPGGDGSPGVHEFAIAELAIGLRIGLIATRHLAGDALDLRHRFPETYAAVKSLVLDVWVARKIVSLARRLDRHAVAEVDLIVAAQAGQHPTRLLAIAEKAIIQADPSAHRERIIKDEQKTGFWLTKPRPGHSVDRHHSQPATRKLTGRVSLTGAVDLEQTIEHLADILGTRAAANDGSTDHEAPTRDQLRAQALELLADPHLAAEVLDAPEPDAEPAPETQAAPSRTRGRAVLHLHLGRLHLDAVADVEGIGPLLFEQVAALLGNRRISLLPVLDLGERAEVDGYHHPDAMRQRVFERTMGEVWPHSPSRSRRLDYDHVVPYRPPADGGPPGQTSDANTAPLTRAAHRYKTHGGFTCTQNAPGIYRWTTPHGITRLVTATGTKIAA